MTKTKSAMYAAWLQHGNGGDIPLKNEYARLLGKIVAEERSPVVKTAVRELVSSVGALLGLHPAIVSKEPKDGFTRIATKQNMSRHARGAHQRLLDRLDEEGFLLKTTSENGQDQLMLIGGSDRGVVYGVFHLLRILGTGSSLRPLELVENPVNRLRMINHWDNADGSIERGYAGRSIFFRGGKVVNDMSRVRDYARMLASVGINAVAINNVNVHETETRFIAEAQLTKIARIADVFRRYGIALFLSVNFAAPMQVGGLPTADPLDKSVRNWWKSTAANIYRHIPDFGGFLVKADSEHRPGPFHYGRNHADGANMLAEALAPFGGLVVWRCFVYNCVQDWRDRSTDRAKAAYDHFRPLDGRFRDNVILQIKYGPMDFQVREPVSPLFGAMTRTNQLIEFQITQEYTGQQKHLCYLVPLWKEAVDFDTYALGQGSTVGRIASGSLFGAKYGGFAAVSNVGDEENWTGHTLAQANLYGYGRLGWNPDLSAAQIAEEWIRLTFGNDEDVVAAISDMLLRSREIYEKYTAPLGVGWMVAPHTHYGPDVDGYEYSRWGTYHYADRDGVGADRTTATGTGFTAQYREPNAGKYESVETCPDELLLFFHHVNYRHRLHSGKTVIQHIYDSHFEGAEQAEQLLESWKSLEGKIDSGRFNQVLERLREQAAHAREWRDVINSYFYRKSGVPDKHGRTIH